MKKLIFLTCCLLIYYLIKNLNISLYHEVISLEDKYNEKLLSHFDISREMIDENCQLSENYQDCKKAFIMEYANLSENEYRDYFTHPISQLKEIKDTSFDEVNKIVKEIIDLQFWRSD